MEQRKSRDSKYYVHLPISFSCGITTCQPLLPVPQKQRGLQRASLEIIFAISGTFLAQHTIHLPLSSLCFSRTTLPFPSKHSSVY